MKAIILHKKATIESEPLVYTDVDEPELHKDELLLKVSCCGVCRTDLHIVEGELPPPKLPLILGHQVVAIVGELGEGIKNFKRGDRVGVPWLYWSCSTCKYCKRGLENLCDNALFTGYNVDGGYAEYMVARGDFVYPIQKDYDDLHAAPLLCGGAIGYRALKLTKLLERGEGNLGLFGFGSSAHMITQVALKKGLQIYVFTRGKERQEYALSLGAKWAGAPTDKAPIKLDAAIIFAPAGWVMVEALKKLDKGGRVVLADIYMTPVERLDYNLLWLEREIKSVANVASTDVKEFLTEASKAHVKPDVIAYSLKDANKALQDLKQGKIRGSAVLKIN
ncbi:MAG: zinc-dependent alcohol dehydrogenase family protein [archaeon]|nr:zinc-dependent alcohol dehydrogenase family protein [archaeon]MCP8314286.1 zinc-dependent alcohol dehydrogenase family protein [archaeon]MCP8315776.1 zinc-dependent alcohol dehydrogenase family protein [archaeon]MCP8321070.1 zinc-dependent alcohol dehydrogenase family protein [archaeon]